MINKPFIEIFYHFRKKNYVKVFSEMEKSDLGLTVTEAMCAEIIFLLGKPTLKEFADYMKISQPNATYKINNMISKGIVKRIPSQCDKREHFLSVTDRFSDFYGLNAPYVKDVVNEIHNTFTAEELAQLEDFLNQIVTILEK